jgi:hypothetical protein
MSDELVTRSLHPKSRLFNHVILCLESSHFDRDFSESVGDIHRTECPRVCYACVVDVKYLTVPL